MRSAQGSGPRTAVALALLLAGTASADAADPWFGADKAEHFVASAVIASVGYGLSSFWVDKPSWRLASGTALGLSAGVGKELLDLSGFGQASWRDLTWDLLGTLTGALLTWTVDTFVIGPLMAASHCRPPSCSSAGP